MYYNYKILGVGHPRTGTAYTSKLLQYFGLNVGHETLMEDGIVAWQMLLPFENFQENGLPWMNPKDIDWSKLRFDTVVYNVRNPKDSIGSIIATENSSYPFRCQIIDFKQAKNIVEKTIISIIGFDEIIKQKYRDHFVYRVEDQKDLLGEYISSKYNTKKDTKTQQPNNNYNTIKHRKNYKPIDFSFEEIDEKYIKMLKTYCKEYGYDNTFLDM